MTTQEFVFDAPLFCKVEGEDADLIIHDLKGWYGFKIDGFNAQKGVESTFTISDGLNCRRNIASSGFSAMGKHVIFEYEEPWFVSLECGRYGDKIDIMIVTNTEKHAIMKVGQYPTVADVHKKQIKKYKKVLGDERMGEFARAIGLAASGVGIGSFLYLRRIFESLIYEASIKAISDGVIKEEEFGSLHIEEKIATLKDYLPDTLIEIKSAYGILSKGIHELSEEECLAYFDVMRNGIELILDEILDAKRKEEKRKATIASVAKIKGQIVSAE